MTTLATAVPFEVVVVDSSRDGTAKQIAATFPEVTLVTSTSRLYPGDARNLGVERARTEILAFIDTDCIVDARWIEEIAAAHRTDVLAAGGSVENANPESVIGWGELLLRVHRVDARGRSAAGAGDPHRLPERQAARLR